MDVMCFNWNNKSYNFKANFYINWKVKSFKGSKHFYKSKHILNDICSMLFKIKNTHMMKSSGMDSSDGGTTIWIYLVPVKYIL